MLNESILTSPLHSLDTEWFPNGELLREDTYSSTTVVQAVRRWSVKNPNPPGRYGAFFGTLPYTVERFLAPIGSYEWKRLRYEFAFGANSFYEVGSFTAVSFQRAQEFYYDPENLALVEEAVTAAKNAAFDRIQDASWNAPVFVGEFEKTVKSILESAKYIAEVTRTVKRYITNPQKGSRVLRKLKQRQKPFRSAGYHASAASGNAANLWLQWRYEVQTTVSDMQSLAQTAADLLLKGNIADPYNRVEVRRTKVRELSPYVRGDASWDRGTGPGLRLSDVNVTHTLSRIAHVVAKAWLVLVHRNSALSSANELGLINVPLVIWELTQLSFVADWLLDLGAYLQRLSAAVGYDIVDAGLGWESNISGTLQIAVGPHPLFQYRIFSGGSGGGIYRYQKYHRIVWENPTPVWTPGFHMNLNRFIDAAALLRGMAR